MRIGTLPPKSVAECPVYLCYTIAARMNTVSFKTHPKGRSEMPACSPLLSVFCLADACAEEKE